MVRLRAVAVVCALVAVSLAAGPARAQVTGQDAVDSCVSHAGAHAPRLCRSAQSLVWISAALCRYGGAPQDTCRAGDGRDVSPAAVEAYEASWTHRALTLQRALDDEIPLRHALIPATHNSYNSFAYPPTLSGYDANHVLSMTDQLRLDMRSLELDVHWAPSVEGDPAQGGRAPILCHGRSESGQHPGCTAERHLRHGLAEIRAWLDANPHEFLLLYMENHLDGSPAAHAAAAAAITHELGGLVRPPAQRCAPLPMDMSRAEIVAAGHRVVMVGNCDPAVAGEWGSFVHLRGPTWLEGNSGPGDGFDCEADRARRDYASSFIRYYDGGTWLQAMTGDVGETPPAETARMVACGVNLLGFDHLTPDDPRLDAVVWSWAPGDPAASGCAYRGGDGRFRSDGCEEPRPYVCFDGTHWSVTGPAGSWDQGAEACAAAGTAFSVPRTGWQNAQVPAGEAWVAYRETAGSWTAH
ncbi:MAG TPA: hypothetical protein VM840_04470 [Actinomycetota bacterium]|nr:hypothetical protein [Actinomycetota bacterium]